MSEEDVIFGVAAQLLQNMHHLHDISWYKFHGIIKELEHAADFMKAWEEALKDKLWCFNKNERIHNHYPF